MAVQLSTTVNEESAFIVQCDFKDENSAGVTPNSIIWVLSDNFGNVINSRSAVTATVSTMVKIVLSGNDLVHSTKSDKRVILIKATYDSTNGTSLQMKEEGHFSIENFIKVT